MITSLVLTASLMAPVAPTLPAASPPDSPEVAQPTTSTVSERRDDRELSLNRPSRSGSRTVRIVLRASTVPPALVSWASCVIRRESGGTLDRIQSGVGARNPSSSASGRFQFLDRSWRRGLSFMVRDRLIDFGMPKAQARQVRLHLGSKPISEWHGYWQQIGFLEVVARGGRHHWAGPGC